MIWFRWVQFAEIFLILTLSLTARSALSGEVGSVSETLKRADSAGRTRTPLSLCQDYLVRRDLGGDLAAGSGALLRVTRLSEAGPLLAQWPFLSDHDELLLLVSAGFDRRVSFEDLSALQSLSDAQGVLLPTPLANFSLKNGRLVLDFAVAGRRGPLTAFLERAEAVIGGAARVEVLDAAVREVPLARVSPRLFSEDLSRAEARDALGARLAEVPDGSPLFVNDPLSGVFVIAVDLNLVEVLLVGADPAVTSAWRRATITGLGELGPEPLLWSDRWADGREITVLTAESSGRGSVALLPVAVFSELSRARARMSAQLMGWRSGLPEEILETAWACAGACRPVTSLDLEPSESIGPSEPERPEATPTVRGMPRIRPLTAAELARNRFREEFHDEESGSFRDVKAFFGRGFLGRRGLEKRFFEFLTYAAVPAEDQIRLWQRVRDEIGLRDQDTSNANQGWAAPSQRVAEALSLLAERLGEALRSHGIAPRFEAHSIRFAEHWSALVDQISEALKSGVFVATASEAPPSIADWEYDHIIVPASVREQLDGLNLTADDLAILMSQQRWGTIHRILPDAFGYEGLGHWLISREFHHRQSPDRRAHTLAVLFDDSFYPGFPGKPRVLSVFYASPDVQKYYFQVTARHMALNDFEFLAGSNLRRITGIDRFVVLPNEQAKIEGKHALPMGRLAEILEQADDSVVVARNRRARFSDDPSYEIITQFEGVRYRIVFIMLRGGVARIITTFEID